MKVNMRRRSQRRNTRDRRAKGVKTEVTKETAQKLVMKNDEQERLKDDEDEEAS